jgi:hypothetical protein
MLVRNPVRQWQGVNALLYEEPDDSVPLPQPSTTRAALQSIEGYAAAGKTLRGSSKDVPPGGNAVDAYIDVVVAGDIAADVLDRVEQRTREELEDPAAAETIAWAEGGVLVRAYVRPDKNPAETLGQLMAAARDLVANPRRTQPPIRIREIRGPDGVVFELDEQSMKRLRALHGAEWTAPRVGISDDVREAFEKLHGDIHDQLAVVMTGIDRSYLTRLGGVEVIDERDFVIWPTSQ